jgi:hypothetical protein
VTWVANTARIDEIAAEEMRPFPCGFGRCGFNGVALSLCHAWFGPRTRVAPRSRCVLSSAIWIGSKGRFQRRTASYACDTAATQTERLRRSSKHPRKSKFCGRNAASSNRELLQRT